MIICVRNMSPELQPMEVQYYLHLSLSISHNHQTALPLEGVLVTWYRRISYIYTFWFNFYAVLCQFLEIDVLWVSFNSWDSQVSAYTPFYFPFTVSLSMICLPYNQLWIHFASHLAFVECLLKVCMLVSLYVDHKALRE